jgi:DNA-binding Lrp family transcriptional regulator
MKNMSTNQEQFLMVPFTILQNKELKDSDKMTLALIYSFHNNKKEIYISNNKLGYMLGVSRTTASERITKLESLGYIKCERVMINGKERRTIVPLKMVGEPKPLVGTPNLLVGKPNSISRYSDTSLVGEVGSIIYPLLNNELNKISHNELNKENSVEDKWIRKGKLETQLKQVFKFIPNIIKLIQLDDMETIKSKNVDIFEDNINLIEEYKSIKI